MIIHLRGSATRFIYLSNTVGKGKYDMEVDNSVMGNAFKLVVLE